MRWKWLALVAVAAMFPAVAQAQALRWSDPEAFRQAMVEAGYEADLFSSDQGSARINAHLRGARGSFNIDFLPCDGDESDECRALQFSLPYVLDSVPALRAAWNRSQGLPENRALSLGEGGYDDPVSVAMEMAVDVPAAGLPRVEFLAKLRNWQALVDRFERMIAQADEGSGGAAPAAGVTREFLTGSWSSGSCDVPAATYAVDGTTDGGRRRWALDGDRLIVSRGAEREQSVVERLGDDRIRLNSADGPFELTRCPAAPR